MAKSFSIKNNPTFKSVVNIPRVGGEDLPVQFEFKTIPRNALGALMDKWRREAVELFTQAQEEEWDYERLTGSEINLHVAQVQDIVVGWGFKEEFNEDNITELCASSAFVLESITEVYHKAFQRAKSGN